MGIAADRVIQSSVGGGQDPEDRSQCIEVEEALAVGLGAFQLEWKAAVGGELVWDQYMS
jgi:hypothetical protein